MKRQSQQGIALVITLIMLSVITFMAVTFLVVSRHEGEQVDTTTQQNISKLASEASLQMAEAQISAIMLGTTNGYNCPFLVSTNYVSPFYDTGGVLNAVTNVNYYDKNGTPLGSANQLQQMLNNLLYLPRAPVFVSTNRNQPNPEFRFYLDENGNGRFDTNGLVTNLDINGKIIMNGTVPSTSVQVGDPEWVGFLEHPEQRHSASNMFLSRGAFIAIPIGDALDVNYIHNQSKFLRGVSPTASAYEGYLRNEGVGSWEINMATFLGGLNNNVWSDYTYSTDPTAPSKGINFYDAASIVQYRNNGNYTTLNSFQGLYGNAAANYFGNDFVDGYTIGPLLTTVSLPAVDLDMVHEGNPWSGADNPIQIIRPRDLLTAIPGLSSFNPLNSFTNHLYSAGTNLDTYDRYTFYRLLAQMGVGSAPEPAPYPIGGSSQFTFTTANTVPAGVFVGAPWDRNQMSYGTVPEAYPYMHARKMNLNYNNVGYNGVALTATNFVPWTPVGFFTNAADRLLRAYYPTNFAIMVNGRTVVTNININFIPVYPVNYYTPALHRLLQLAANMYDASTNKSTTTLPIDYPSVFRPSFGVSGSGANTFVYVTGYTEQLIPNAASSPNDPFWSAPLDLRRPADVSQLVANTQNGTNLINNIYAVPYVVGARTNLPNFNQFSMASVVQISRTLQFSRTGPTAPVSSYKTNVAYTIGVSNVVGLQCWNSYTNYFNRPNLRIFAVDDFSMQVSNTYTGTTNVNTIFGLLPAYTVPNNPQINPWPNGLNPSSGTFTPLSFIVPMMTNAVALSNNYSLMQNGTYSTNGSVFLPLAVNPITRSYYPDWGINVTNRVRVIIQDPSGRILDYVQLGGLGQLAGPDSQDSVISNLYSMNLPPGVNLWDTNVISTNNPLPGGLYNQYQVSLGVASVPSSYWSSSPSGSAPASITLAIQGFKNWLTAVNPANQIQLPFVATTVYGKVYSWSANDPLVHYTVGDLTDLTKTGANNIPVPLTVNSTTNVLSGLTKQSTRYFPWGKVPGDAVMNKIGSDELEYTDPLITQASAWQFSTNKYPNVGWLGRVHRGTPWQTVYLKPHSAAFNTNAWQYWTGNPNVVDAINSQPMNDWQMLDLFTTAPNDNASRGQLSVNQTNLAAWEAVLGSLVVLSNSPGSLTATNVDPSQSNPVNGNILQYIASSINAYRASLPNQTFSSMGQILQVPQLTTASPYLNTSVGNISDAVYEWMPQQLMSLLRVGTPRYAIYAYGQALKPANNSIVQSGQYFGMCTNYQITGEVLTRTIVRFDNMPIPGYPQPGTAVSYALPVQGATTTTYAIVNNVIPPMRAVVESFEILGPDQ